MPGTIISDASSLYRIACTRLFRFHPLPQIQISCRPHESYENRTDTGEGRVIVLTLACHKPREQLCLLPYFRLVNAVSPFHRTDRMNRVLTSVSGMLFSRCRFSVSKNAAPLQPNVRIGQLLFQIIRPSTITGQRRIRVWIVGQFFRNY